MGLGRGREEGGFVRSKLWRNLFSLTSFRFQWVRCLYERRGESRLWDVAASRRRSRSGREGEGDSTGEAQMWGTAARRGAARR